MHSARHTSGAVVDERLAPAGLTRLLGSHGDRRASVLAAAAGLFVAACAVLVFVPFPPVTAGLIFVVPVAIIASELGTRAGLITAGLSVAAVMGWLATGLGPEGQTAETPRSLALFFLAWIVGRTSDRAARSRRLLEQVLEATTDKIYVKDLQGRYLVVNTATADLIGRPAAEILGRANDEVLPETAAAIAVHDAAVLEHQVPTTYEMTGTFGTRPYVLSVTKSPFRAATGAVIGSLGIARDITEQRRLQERFRRAFDDAPIGMAVSDLDGHYLDVNQALCTITGYSRDELCGRTFTSMTHPDDLEADYAVMRALVAGELSSSMDEKRYLRPDGSIVWVARSVTLVRNPDGTPLHFIDQVQDVTERRRFEHELRQLADHDPLTGLYNRRRFGQELDRHVAEVARHGPRGALLIVDIDNFKHVNDAYGHHAGDKLIVRVAAVLEGRLRESDIVARLGGDEFAVLLPTADANQAGLVAADLVQAVREQSAADGGEAFGHVTASVGVAPFGAAERSGEMMLIEADLAMYEAKEGGRDRFVVASGERRPARRLRESIR